MNPKEITRSLVDKLCPAIPPEWETYMQKVLEGKEENIPVYGFGHRVILDYYGWNKNKKVEQGRVRLPLPGDRLEISFHVTRSNGTFEVIREGIYHYKG